MNSIGRWEVGENQIVILFSELERVEIKCKCGTGLVISALHTAPELKSLCPGCGLSLHMAATAILHFREFFKAATDCGQEITFRIKPNKNVRETQEKT
ncbi:MAG: hypothetical protein A3J28_10410 [Acidobacteria bacterium RIFCSPLOWO2_12_FULL_60_22]|nr:MAG: hypothetical protein A3J28_10410 [Acidobacteria bacterium RIFCSPLOWO2_12_FULL_60_22]